MGPLLDCPRHLSSSHFLDSSSSFSLSGSSQNSGICLGQDFLPDDPKEDLPLSLFTGVTGGTSVAVLVGSPSTCSTSEASQLAGQVGGPNKDRPSMIPCHTPQMFGMTYTSMTVWLRTILSISCRYVHMIWNVVARKTLACTSSIC